MNEAADDQGPLADLRREGAALRQIAPQKRAAAATAKRGEFKSLVAKALVSSAGFEDVVRELDSFPPLVVGPAIATVWESLSAERRGQLLQRLRSLDAERHSAEGVPMAMQMLRVRSTADAAADVLSGLPSSEKPAQRLASELFGADGIPMEQLRAPDADAIAAPFWRVLFNAAKQDKAQPWRRLQFLKLALAWLSEKERFRKPEYKGSLTSAVMCHGSWIGLQNRL